jgi:hypothetical protein
MWKKVKTNFFLNNKKNQVGPIFQAQAGTITNYFFFSGLYGQKVLLESFQWMVMSIDFDNFEMFWAISVSLPWYGDRNHHQFLKERF